MNDNNIINLIEKDLLKKSKDIINELILLSEVLESSNPKLFILNLLNEEILNLKKKYQLIEEKRKLYDKYSSEFVLNTIFKINEILKLHNEILYNENKIKYLNFQNLFVDNLINFNEEIPLNDFSNLLIDNFENYSQCYLISSLLSITKNKKNLEFFFNLINNRLNNPLLIDITLKFLKFWIYQTPELFLNSIHYENELFLIFIPLKYQEDLLNFAKKNIMIPVFVPNLTFINDFNLRINDKFEMIEDFQNQVIEIFDPNSSLIDGFSDEEVANGILLCHNLLYNSQRLENYIRGNCIKSKFLWSQIYSSTFHNSLQFEFDKYIKKNLNSSDQFLILILKRFVGIRSFIFGKLNQLSELSFPVYSFNKEWPLLLKNRFENNNNIEGLNVLSQVINFTTSQPINMIDFIKKIQNNNDFEFSLPAFPMYNNRINDSFETKSNSSEGFININEMIGASQIIDFLFNMQRTIKFNSISQKLFYSLLWSFFDKLNPPEFV